MSILTQLSSLALDGIAQATDNVGGVSAVASGADKFVGFLRQRFVDHSSRLENALNRASSRAWMAVELALAGRSWWDRCKLTLATADDRALRNQVQVYLDAHPLDGIDGHGPDFRGQCLAQLQAARKAGLLDRGKVDPGELARRVGDLSRLGDPTRLVEAEFRTLDEIGIRLRQQGYEALAVFLSLRPGSGPPLLVSAVRFFFQRELEQDRELFQALAYARLDDLARGQKTGFAGLAQTIEEHGERLEGLLSEVRAVVVETHANVLDMKAELARQGQQMQELGQAVLRALSQHHLERRELHGGDSLSIRDEEERRLVRDLVKRYRGLPASERQKMPALLNAVGKLQVVAGDFESAERDFRDLAKLVPEPSARAEAAHNAYRAALERRAWTEALASLKEAATLDPGRFAPFPVDKFEPERILGAGGFGVAFLCRNRHSSGRVVIKTLLRDGLDRDLGEVFREAQTLEDLEHPAIIRIRDCDYADPGRSRPYFVMDFFPGKTLAEHVEQYGPLEPVELLPLARLMAEGLQRAHGRGILHRDVKPQNLLVKRLSDTSGGNRGNTGWEVKLIDFGLALRAQAKSSTARATLDRTLAGSSIAGTLDYAAPEQMGKLKNVPIGPCSDVYGFGKTCCFALFGTPQPTFQHWQKLSPALADLLGRCLSEQPRDRPQDFTAVLRELDRLQSTPPRADRASRPAAVPIPLMTAQPVAEVEEVEEVRPLARAAKSRSRKRERDDRDDRDDRDEREVARPRRWGGLLGCLLVPLGIIGFLIGAPLLLLFLFRWGPSPQGGVGQGFTSFGSGTTEVKYVPITEKEFPEALAEMKKRPALKRFQDLAGQLSVTDPTEKQKAKHRAVKNLQEMRMGKAPAVPLAKLDAAIQEDEILQVSRALTPLLRERDLDSQRLAANALEKWGTPENVPDLIGLLSAGGFGADAVRMAGAKALGAIGDPRGIGPVVARLDDTWDRMQQGKALTEAITRFGPLAEDELLKSFDKNSPFTQGTICDLLKEVGTRKSLPALKKAAANFHFRGNAQGAIAVIEARYPEAGTPPPPTGVPVKPMGPKKK